jgi:hypothetical protein
VSDRLSALDDYVSGHMPDDEADAFEAALFDAAGEDGDSAFLAELARVAALLVAHGTWESGATRAQVDAMLARGDVALIDLDVPGEREVPRSAAQVVFKVSVPLHDVDRLDIEFEVPGHGVFKTLRDLAFDRADGAIFIVCEAALNEASARVRAISRLIAYRGGERVALGESVAGVAVVDP